MKKAKHLTLGFCFAVMAALPLVLPAFSYAQSNPCSPTTKKATRNPCAANPCGPGAAAAPTGKAITARGEVVRVDPNAKKLVLKADGRQLDLTFGKYAVVREGAQVKPLNAIKPGEKVTVSYVESGKERTAWYVYLASAASAANPCAANPCAVKNPCAAQNPCAANPCAPKGKKAK
ncbi:MAG: hypothetical protein HY695_24850 [Deltaproteobacteria bacterium]|nr:hypothetical protein [Deltaproteobacteria bacterium]